MSSLREGLFEIRDEDFPYGSRVGDFDRVLAYLYYNDQVRRSQINGRVGFAYTESDDRVINKEVLYGIGARVNKNWALAFEQRYDIERNEFSRQRYEIRRRLHRWELAIQLRDRQAGIDFGFELSLTDFPGARLRF